MEEKLIVINAFSPALGIFNIGRFNETLQLYHCYDEIGAAEWFGVHGAQLEEEYMPKVDGIVCTSRGLFNTKKAYNDNTFLVQNGVNFELFNKGFNDNIAQEKKIIGYVGTIDDRLDYPLLEKLFEDFKNWEFHFVGRCNYDPGRQILEKYDNVKMPGSVPVTELPKVLSTFHAGLIPFVENDFTRGIYPLKINEYLAAGIPVILTRFSDLSEFEDIASICDSHEEFSQLLGQEVEEDNLSRRRQRVEIAQTNSWPGRWKQFEDIIDQLEERKSLQ
jgi:glycosyltransferase involved in cell wall biosynthesis